MHGTGSEGIYTPPRLKTVTGRRCHGQDFLYQFFSIRMYSCSTYMTKNTERLINIWKAKLSPRFKSDKWTACFVSSGIFAKPDHVKMTYPETQLRHLLPLLLICDNLRDPGNLGTILRSAAGAGCSKVLLTKGQSTCFWVDWLAICKWAGSVGRHTWIWILGLPLISHLSVSSILSVISLICKVGITESTW